MMQQGIESWIPDHSCHIASSTLHELRTALYVVEYLIWVHDETCSSPPTSPVLSSSKQEHDKSRISVRKVVESLETLYNEGALMPGGERKRFAVVEIRGDWKWQQDFL